MYPGPVEVDWNIGPESQATRPRNAVPIVERFDVPVLRPTALSPEQRRERMQNRLTFFWAMAPIGIKLCGRGETRRAVSQFDLQVSAYIDLWRLLHEPESATEPHSANPILNPALRSSIPPLGPSITPASTLAACHTLADLVEDLLPGLRIMGVTVPDEMVRHVNALRTIAIDELARGTPGARPYR
jgi:hypothetical protein